MKPWERYQTPNWEKVDNVQGEIDNLKASGDLEAADKLSAMAKNQKPWDKFNKTLPGAHYNRGSMPSVDPTYGNNFFYNLAAGLGKAGADTGRGLGELVGAVTPQEVDEARQLDKPLLNTAGGVLGDFAGQIGMTLAQGMAAAKYGSKIPVAGEALANVGRMVTTPKSLLEALGGGSILGATQPVGTDDSRLLNAAISSGAAGVIPAGVGGYQLGKRFISDHMPTNTALKQIQDVFGDIPVPTQAPNIGMTYQQRGLPSDFVGAPTPRFGNVQGINPTIGMLTDSPELLRLEQRARTRSPEKFYPVDNANNAAVYQAIESKALSDAQANRLQDALNTATEPQRQLAYSLANNDPNLIDPVMNWILDTAEKPGVRGSNSMPLLNKANRQTSMPDVQAEDLYTLRKEIGDTLNLKTLAPDELTNSAKSNRRLSTQLMEEIDSALNSSSNGVWDDYLSTYSKSMAPIEEGRSMQNILDRFANNKPTPGTDSKARMVTPAGLRKAVADETYKNMGKKGEVSTVSGQTRGLLSDAMDVMNSLDNAKTGPIATNGPATAPLMANLIEGALPKSGLLGTVLDYAKKAGIRSGNGILDDAMLSPEQFQILLNKYHARPAPSNSLLPGSVKYAFLPTVSGLNLLKQ